MPISRARMFQPTEKLFVSAVIANLKQLLISGYHEFKIVTYSAVLGMITKS